ncbi:MAG: response regulator [Pseudorhodoplanes sp.]
MPIDVVEAAGPADLPDDFASAEIDLILIDATLPEAEKTALIARARAAPKQPFIILMAGVGGTITEEADAVVAKPRNVDEAQKLAERCMRVRLPSRVLVVDDSSMMRKIVGKTISATRFPVEIVEAEEGEVAIARVHEGDVDIVFLDYNMPGLDGLETLQRLKKAQPSLEIIFMTSVADQAVEARAHRGGAAAFLKKPFYPADVEAVLRGYYGLLKPAQ